MAQPEGSNTVNHTAHLQLQSDITYVAFAGGVGNFGANLAVVHCNGRTIWVDAGSGFGNASLPGVTKVLPHEQIVSDFIPDAIVLTHGHEDHIGAFTFLEEIIPDGTSIFASKMTLAMLKNRLKEHGIDQARFNIEKITENTKKELPGFHLHFFFMPHSIPQAFSLGIENKVNRDRLLFTGDFKLKGNEPRFRFDDFDTFKSLNYLFCDSTGSLSEGEAENDREVHKNLKKIISEHDDRIFISLFSSHIERVRAIFEIAAELGRPVGIQGYSIKAHIKAAYEAGELDFNTQDLRPPSEKNPKSIWLIAGCQSEKGSSFYRFAFDDRSRFRITDRDLVIYSASMIPGNEENIFAALNNIVNRGARVTGISKTDMKVHSSGHGKSQDLVKLIKKLKPATVIPVHGDPVHFDRFQQIVKEAGTASKVQKAMNRNLYRLEKEALQLEMDYGPSYTFVEDAEIHNDVSIYQRRIEMHTEGICNVIVDEQTFRLLALDYVGVCSQAMFEKKIATLKKDVKTILENYQGSNSKKKEKRLREKIFKLNMSHLKKAPYVNLLFISC